MRTIEEVTKEIEERIKFVIENSDYIQPIYAEEELKYLLDWIKEPPKTQEKE